VHVVIGSSGLTSGDYQELDRLAWDRGVGVIAAGNFSVMAAVLRHAASMAAQHLDHWEIIDYASDDKSDAPRPTQAPRRWPDRGLPYAAWPSRR
jgi:4-hydroxy-tetrahydrodipicolinate reductase